MYREYDRFAKFRLLQMVTPFPEALAGTEGP